MLDKFTPHHLHINFGVDETEGFKTKLHKTTLLILAITLQNIPEALADGVLFGAAAIGMEDVSVSKTSPKVLPLPCRYEDMASAGEKVFVTESYQLL